MFVVFNHEKRKNIFLDYIKDWTVGCKSVIDVGAGGGEFSEWFTQQGYKTTSVDVKDKSRRKNIKPIIFDGSNLPFANDEFDLGLLFTVLHHTQNPDILIKETLRVAKKLIIIEDIYANDLEKIICMANCSLANREFFNHPHSNRDDLGWKETFKRLNLKLIDSKYFRQLFYGVPLYMGLYLVVKN